jgi:hypothetical protein
MTRIKWHSEILLQEHNYRVPWKQSWEVNAVVHQKILEFVTLLRLSRLPNAVRVINLTCKMHKPRVNLKRLSQLYKCPKSCWKLFLLRKAEVISASQKSINAILQSVEKDRLHQLAASSLSAFRNFSSTGLFSLIIYFVD